MAMGDHIQLDLLRDWWLAYLLRQGHHVVGEPESIVVIRSRNGRRKPYRWLLMTCEGPARGLTREEHGRLRKEIALASRSQERPYVVVGFTGEPRRIVAIPTSSALAARVVRSDRGGIAWED
jgi:hypothetical protein